MEEIDKEISLTISTAMDMSVHSGAAELESETPRETPDYLTSSPSRLPMFIPAPVSPHSVRKKTKARASKGLNRHDSLKESKVREKKMDQS